MSNNLINIVDRLPIRINITTAASTRLLHEIVDAIQSYLDAEPVEREEAITRFSQHLAVCVGALLADESDELIEDFFDRFNTMTRSIIESKREEQEGDINA